MNDIEYGKYANSTANNLTDVKSTQEVSQSPVDKQVCSLENRLDSIANLLGELTSRIDPVLRNDSPPKEAQATVREAGQSALHERLVLLNEKASNIARYIAHTTSRVTV
jgi:hypothetical protein